MVTSPVVGVKPVRRESGTSLGTGRTKTSLCLWECVAEQRRQMNRPGSLARGVLSQKALLSVSWAELSPTWAVAEGPLSSFLKELELCDR